MIWWRAQKSWIEFIKCAAVAPDQTNNPLTTSAGIAQMSLLHVCLLSKIHWTMWCPQMYLFFSQLPTLSRPLLHSCIFSILPGTSEKITSSVSSEYFVPFIPHSLALSVSLPLSNSVLLIPTASWVLTNTGPIIIKKQMIRQPCLETNTFFCLRQKACLREFRSKAMMEPSY